MSLRDDRLIQQLYRPHLDLLVLVDFGDLEPARGTAAWRRFRAIRRGS